MNISKIQRGSIVKIWTYPKGHDYVVVGDDKERKELQLIKLNCINGDGSVHKATKRFHKVIPYSMLGNKRVVQGVSRILGNKDLETRPLRDFIRENVGNHTRLLPANRHFVCTPVTDNTELTNYN